MEDDFPVKADFEPSPSHIIIKFVQTPKPKNSRNK